MSAVQFSEPSSRFGGAENQVAAATRSVWKTFGATPVLRDVSITIPFKDTRGLVGRNGAGKSTLVGVLTGLLAPTSGSVELGGEPAPPIADRGAWRQRVACVYQRWTVLPSLTVAENLFLNNQPLRSSGAIDWPRMREEARAVLLEWGLDVDPDLEAGRLAVDQRQIVEIGRALLQGSRFIILDEPTAELERREVHQLFDRLKALQQSGVTFVYISHHLEELYEICRSVTVLRDGVIVAEGLSVRATEEAVTLANRAGPVTPPKRRNPIQMPGLQDIAERLSGTFDTRVTVSLGKRKGKIVVEFGSVDDLQRIVEMMDAAGR